MSPQSLIVTSIFKSGLESVVRLFATNGPDQDETVCLFWLYVCNWTTAMSWTKRRDDAYTVISEVLSVLIGNSKIYFYLLKHCPLMKCLLLVKVTLVESLHAQVTI
jgi:hypothetical protein